MEFGIKAVVEEEVDLWWGVYIIRPFSSVRICVRMFDPTSETKAVKFAEKLNKLLDKE